MTDEQIVGFFGDTNDFIRRQLNCCGVTLYVYGVDGLISGRDMSECVLKPVSEILKGSSAAELYRAALEGTIYNSVVSVCADANDAALKLVNVVRDAAVVETAHRDARAIIDTDPKLAAPVHRALSRELRAAFPDASVKAGG